MIMPQYLNRFCRVMLTDFLGGARVSQFASSMFDPAHSVCKRHMLFTTLGPLRSFKLCVNCFVLAGHV